MRRIYRSRRQVVLKAMLYFIIFLLAFADGTLNGEVLASGGLTCQQDLPLEVVAARWGLTPNREACYGPLELTGRDVSLRVAPGLRFAMVNNRVVTLSKAPAFKNGTLILPGELLQFLPSPVVQTKRVTSDMVVIIDPGHGGKDPGAIGYKGIREKDVTLKVGLYVQQYLNNLGIKVKMTRANDFYPSLEERSDLANRTPNSVFISIHANAARESSVKGVETFVLANRISDTYRSQKAAANYSPAYLQQDRYSRRQNEAVMHTVCREARSESMDLACEIHKKLILLSGDVDRGVKKDNLHVLRESYFSPAILVELGFLTHPPSARKLVQDEYQRRLAKAIADGVVNYLVQSRNTRPTTAWDTLLSKRSAERWN